MSAQAQPGESSGLKQRAMQALKIYWVITLYLWILLGVFTTYRRLVVAETGDDYLHYGVSLVEALIIAKVVLIGKMFGFSRRYEDRALVWPVLYKSVLFGALVLLFGVVEHLVGGWIHKQGLWAGLHEIAAIGSDELLARVLMLMFAFIPFFAFWELGRVIGMHKLAGMFFTTTPKVPT